MAAAESALKMHNEFRLKHGAPPLELDEKLNEQAKLYAEAALRCTVAPSIGNLGVNIYSVCDCEVGEESPEIISREAVFGWYEYLKDYNWDTPTQSPKDVAAAVQIIWKGTKTLGVGVASEGEESVVVALYSPAGNALFDQVHKDNVEKASG